MEFNKKALTSILKDIFLWESSSLEYMKENIRVKMLECISGIDIANEVDMSFLHEMPQFQDEICYMIGYSTIVQFLLMKKEDEPSYYIADIEVREID